MSIRTKMILLALVMTLPAGLAAAQENKASASHMGNKNSVAPRFPKFEPSDIAPMMQEAPSTKKRVQDGKPMDPKWQCNECEKATVRELHDAVQELRSIKGVLLKPIRGVVDEQCMVSETHKCAASVRDSKYGSLPSEFSSNNVPPSVTQYFSPWSACSDGKCYYTVVANNLNAFRQQCSPPGSPYVYRNQVSFEANTWSVICGLDASKMEAEQFLDQCRGTTERNQKINGLCVVMAPF